MSDGDARRALSALEIGVLSAETTPVEFTLQVAQDSIQRKALDYDPTGDTHYDVASAFIKSMRGSDPDAAIYLAGADAGVGRGPAVHRPAGDHLRVGGRGQRRPAGAGGRGGDVAIDRVYGIAGSAVGAEPGGRVYCHGPKSNACTVAIGKARDDVKNGRTLPVPAHCATPPRTAVGRFVVHADLPQVRPYRLSRPSYVLYLYSSPWANCFDRRVCESRSGRAPAACGRSSRRRGPCRWPRCRRWTSGPGNIRDRLAQRQLRFRQSRKLDRLQHRRRDTSGCGSALPTSSDAQMITAGDEPRSSPDSSIRASQ